MIDQDEEGTEDPGREAGSSTCGIGALHPATQVCWERVNRLMREEAALLETDSPLSGVTGLGYLLPIRSYIEVKEKNPKFQKKLALAGHLTFTVGARNFSFYLADLTGVLNCPSF